MNTTLNKIESLVSSLEEYNMLLECDKIYLILGNGVGDVNLKFHASDFFKDYETCRIYTKLRGPKNGPYKINNKINVFDHFHGYIVGLDESDSEYFEQMFTLFSIETGYTYEKIDIKKYKDEIKEAKDKFFASIFGER